MYRVSLPVLIIGMTVAASPALAAGSVVDPLVIQGDIPASAAPMAMPMPGPTPAAQPAFVPARPAATRTAVYATPHQSNLGGGFIEMLVTGGASAPRRAALYNTPSAQPAPMRQAAPPSQMQAMAYEPAPLQAQRVVPSQFMRSEVDYASNERPGTIVVDTPSKYLYLVLGSGRAVRYGIGVGRPGFTWSGVKSVTRKAEWPDWTPPPEMLLRRPDLPRHMEGGPANPLGARALYLGSSLYRIHGTNEPHTIGQNVSSGCIRMMNEDVTDLYERVRVGTRVVVI